MENWTVKSVDGKEVGAPEAAPAVETATPEVAQEPQSKQEEEQAIVQEAVVDNPNVEIEDDNVIKVNLDQPPVKEEAKDEQQVPDEIDHTKDNIQPVPETEQVTESESPIERITQEEPKEENLETVKVEAEQPVAIHEEPQVQAAADLPEGIDGLVDFMKETGGSLEDYLNMNKSYDDMHPADLMYEHYKTSKPHLSNEEIDFLMDDKFGWDEDASEKEIARKKLLFKEELYDAKKQLNTNRDKYYKDLKFNNVAPEYQDAYKFQQEYKQSQESNQKLHDVFQQKTNQVFNDEFKGFDFKVGDDTYRYKVGDTAKTKEYQSDINNFIGEFLGEDGSISDASGYHKALFAAKNADKLAQHFYEQGRADAIKTSAKEAKNISMNPRQDMSASVTTKSGTKVRVVDGNENFGNKLRFKNYNNR